MGRERGRTGGSVADEESVVLDGDGGHGDDVDWVLWLEDGSAVKTVVGVIRVHAGSSMDEGVGE
jgi:hypothetical protein